ncbi:MAG: TonB C-terminal domain-containing protein [Candidatus Obscuribacterales bacterium]|nr:TonB C-terminal domain-containing protein [Candidatus Obscuribacterales bacterium]
MRAKYRGLVVIAQLMLNCALPAFAVESAQSQPSQSKLNKMLSPVAAAKAAKEKITNAKEKITTAKDKITKSLLPAEPAVPLRDKWALIVGLEKFNDDSIRPIKFAQQNSVLMSSFLANPELGRFGASRVVIVTNNKATKNNVTKALGDTWLLKNALPNDLIVLYFSTRVKLKSDGSDLLLYMFDTPSTQPDIGSIELKAMLKNLRQRTQSQQILCLLDVGPDIKKKSQEEGNQDDAPAPTDLDAPSTHVTLQQIAEETGTTILAASEIGGRSYPSSTKGCSSFVENLLEGLATSNGQIEFDQVAQYVTKMVKSKVATDFKREQTPVFASSDQSALMLKTVIGTTVKSSTPEKVAKIGHPPERAPDAPMRSKPGGDDKVVSINPTRSITTKMKPVQEDDESYDNAEFGNVDFGPYMTKMKRDIQAKWKPPKGFNEQRVIAVFSIKKDGTIANASIVDGSGSEPVDKSAMEALEAASPLDPLPQGSPPYVQIRYQFDWKVTKN